MTYNKKAQEKAKKMYYIRPVYFSKEFKPQYIQLKKILSNEGISFVKWLEKSIAAYIKKRGGTIRQQIDGEPEKEERVKTKKEINDEILAEWLKKGKKDLEA